MRVASSNSCHFCPSLPGHWRAELMVEPSLRFENFYEPLPGSFSAVPSSKSRSAIRSCVSKWRDPWSEVCPRATVMASSSARGPGEAGLTNLSAAK